MQDAEAHSAYVYLEAYARSYEALLPLADAVVSIAPHVPLSDAKSVVGGVWAAHLGEYLAAEELWAKGLLETQCEKWQRNVRRPSDAARQCRPRAPRINGAYCAAVSRREALVPVQI